MTTPELRRESHDPSHTKPSQVKNSLGHPIHPTPLSSTPAQMTVDGSNDIDQIRHSLGIAERELTGIPYTPPEVVIAWARPLAAMVRRLLDEIGTTTKAAEPTCSRTDHLTSSCDHNATDVRPVVPVVARALGVDQLRRWLALATGQAVVGDGVLERISRAHEARRRLSDALPAVLDELEQLRGETVRPSLAELQARYLEVRQHTLSTAGLTGLTLLDAEAKYVAGEADELLTAIRRLGDCCVSIAPSNLCPKYLAKVRHEIADVVLAATTLAGMLPGDVTVEACIAEKTEADRGRG